MKAQKELAVQDKKAFEASLAENIESAKALENKSLVRIARRTYANSVVRRNGELTETAVLDFVVGAYQDLSEGCTVQMLVKFMATEFKMQVSRSRFVKHLADNKWHKDHTQVLEHDVLRFV